MIGPVDPDRPYAGTVCFSDIFGMDEVVEARLIYDGMVFCTDFRHPDGREYCGDVIARNWDHAVEVANARGLGERVIGQIEKRCDARDVA